MKMDIKFTETPDHGGPVRGVVRVVVRAVGAALLPGDDDDVGMASDWHKAKRMKSRRRAGNGAPTTMLRHGAKCTAGGWQKSPINAAERGPKRASIPAVIQPDVGVAELGQRRRGAVHRPGLEVGSIAVSFKVQKEIRQGERKSRTMVDDHF